MRGEGDVARNINRRRGTYWNVGMNRGKGIVGRGNNRRGGTLERRSWGRMWQGAFWEEMKRGVRQTVRMDPLTL